MASALSLKEEFLTCAICTEYYNDPCTLGCQHSFCRKCITNYIKTRPDAVQSRKIPCAFCRQDTRVPNPSKPVEEWAGQFKPSLMLKGLMDRLQSGHTPGEGQNMCFLCAEVGEKAPATSWCCDCEVTLCSRCAKMHLKTPLLMSHDLQDLSDGSNYKQKRKFKCTEHEGEQIKYICKDCNKSACQICCTIKHRTCKDVVTIISMMPEIKSALKGEKCNLERKMETSKLNMTQQERGLQELEMKQGTIASKIKSEIESAITLLRKREKELLKKVGDVTQRYIYQHKASIKSAQITKQMYQQHFELIDQVLQSGSQMEIYEIYQVCQSGALTSVGDTESDTTKSPAIKDVTFTSNMEPLKSVITEMGRVDVTLISETDQSTDKPFTLTTPVLCDTIDIKHRDDNGGADPIDVTVVTVNGMITVVTADYCNKSLKSVYSRRGRKNISVLAVSDHPVRIDRMMENRVAVILNDSRIVIADVKPELVFVSNLATSKQYSNLASLTESTLAAGSSSPPSIDILDLRGNLIRSFTSHNTGLNLLEWPYFMCASQSGSILVSDFSSNSVYCLTPQGGVVFTYTSTGPEYPRGITVTDTGDILLSTGHLNTITHLSSSGTFIRNVLTSTDGIGKPWGVSFHHGNKLYVCDRDVDRCIQVFRFQ